MITGASCCGGVPLVSNYDDRFRHLFGDATAGLNTSCLVSANRMLVVGFEENPTGTLVASPTGSGDLRRDVAKRLPSRGCPMTDHLTPIPAEGIVSIPTVDVQPPSGGRGLFGTRDHDVIRRWAERHAAEPATGEATISGPATVNVSDGDTGLRFNFPGMQRFRSISWTEWFDHFRDHELAFVYEEEVPDRAYHLWQARGGGNGRDLEDWFQAERQIGRSAQRPSAGFRLIRASRVPQLA